MAQTDEIPDHAVEPESIPTITSGATAACGGWPSPSTCPAGRRSASGSRSAPTTSRRRAAAATRCSREYPRATGCELSLRLDPPRERVAPRRQPAMA